MRITLHIPSPMMNNRAAKAIARLESACIISQIAFDPWGETGVVNELLTLGFPPEKTLEVRLTNRDRHLLLPIDHKAG